MKRTLLIGICLVAAFVLWTVLVAEAGVAPIGPEGSAVGFSKLNAAVHNFFGVHLQLYTLTDWLGLVPIFTVFGFALAGLVQWIKRKRILKVDSGILALGVFYIIVFSVYFLFENLAINYRPVLINGVLEASYPSSTTILVLCVMPTALLVLNLYLNNRSVKRALYFTVFGFTAFTVIGRLISGVHWFTDIVGGILISLGLVFVFSFFYLKYIDK